MSNPVKPVEKSEIEKVLQKEAKGQYKMKKISRMNFVANLYNGKPGRSGDSALFEPITNTKELALKLQEAEKNAINQVNDDRAVNAIPSLKEGYNAEIEAGRPLTDEEREAGLARQASRSAANRAPPRLTATSNDFVPRGIGLTKEESRCWLPANAGDSREHSIF